jgi:hypothetical protein
MDFSMDRAGNSSYAIIEAEFQLHCRLVQVWAGLREQSVPPGFPPEPSALQVVALAPSQPAMLGQQI